MNMNIPAIELMKLYEHRPPHGNVCRRCGAPIPEITLERHWLWHGGVDTNKVFLSV